MERLLVSAWGVNKAVLGGSLVYVSVFTSHIYGVTGPSFCLRPAPTMEALFSCALPSVLPSTLGMTRQPLVEVSQPQASPNCPPGSGRQEMGVGRH